MTTATATGCHWNYQSGTYRCDHGWNSGDLSFGCREPGIREINGQWVCDTHTDLISLTYRPAPKDVQRAIEWIATWHADQDNTGQDRSTWAYEVLGHDAWQILVSAAQKWAATHQ